MKQKAHPKAINGVAFCCINGFTKKFYIFDQKCIISRFALSESCLIEDNVSSGSRSFKEKLNMLSKYGLRNS